MTVNHRLNVLGYLDLSAYGEEYRYSGNLGQADIVAALEWVRDNIAAFGGDPDNVTIFGQSGGGGKVTTLMQMPSADGLYHRAIVMSGVMGRRRDPADPYRLPALIANKCSGSVPAGVPFPALPDNRRKYFAVKKAAPQGNDFFS